MENSRVIVITGASSGIGEATAKLLATRGDKLVLGARRVERLEEITASIKKAGGEAIYERTDVTAKAEVQALADLAIGTFGRIDVWINNAGIMPHSAFIKQRTEDWDRMVDVNIKGVLYGIAAALPQMREQAGGQFINLSSVAGHITRPTAGVYSATKFAVRAISEALRLEEAQAGSNVRVTIVSPGAVDTELPGTITDAEVKPGIDQIYQTLAIPPERIANVIAYAIDMPADTALNEIIVRPTKQA